MRESDRQPVIIANHEIALLVLWTLKPLPYQRCFSSPDCCQTSKSQKAVIPAMIVLHQLELAGTVLGERSLCPSRVNRVVLTVRCSLPVYPDERTSSEPVGMSQRCHKRKSTNLIRLPRQRAKASWTIFPIRAPSRS